MFAGYPEPFAVPFNIMKVRLQGCKDCQDEEQARHIAQSLIIIIMTVSPLPFNAETYVLIREVSLILG